MTENTRLEDRYELVEQIGSGGMAEVWLARDTRLRRDVAIKFLDRRLLGNPESHVRFFSEAQAAARISHPNVVKVLDFGRADDVPYLVMEYVSGGTLLELVGEPMDVDQAVDLIAQAAQGAAALHREGLIHRDLKPANILLSRNGTVKVTDLGIAAGRAAEHMTDTGAAIGSPHYVSPEQVSGKEAVPASDVYSLGVVLYETITGVKPFDGETVTAIAIAHVDQEPEPPSTHRPDIPPQIEALILRCMEKDPADRFEDGGALAAALTALWATASAGTAAGTSVAAITEKDRIGTRARVPAGALLVVLLLLAGAALVAARMGTETPAAAGTEEAQSAERTKEKGSSTPSPIKEESNEATEPPVEDENEPKDKDTVSDKNSEPEEKTGSKSEPEPDPSEEPSPEPSPEPTSEPSPQPSPEPETQASPTPNEG